MKVSEKNLQKVETKRELYKGYLILARYLYQQSEPNRMTPMIGEKNKRFLIGAVTFLAFAMEAFINDFGDRFVKDYRSRDSSEKWNTLEKYFILTNLVNSKHVIKKSENLWASLKRLYDYRNLFAHYKPGWRENSEKEEKLYNELDHDVVKKLYKDLVLTLKKFNEEFQMFSGSEDWITDYSLEIH